MRPKFLEIEGLHSYKEPVKIDFELLSDSGIFGIFGPTGSGKSTILDAVTLALYGNVTRAKSGTQGIIHAMATKLRVAFGFELKMPQGSVAFRVERVYQRKKNNDKNADQSLVKGHAEAKVARLIRIQEDGDFPIADKPSEVTGKVEELLGLNHEDFIRAVVLPQNKFHEFLQMDKAKKREMLERIFYLEEYGKVLGEKIARKQKILEGNAIEVNAKLSILEEASDAALQETKVAWEEIVGQKEKLVLAFEDLEKAFLEGKEILDLEIEKEETLKQWEVLCAQKEKISFQKHRLLHSQKADSVKDDITRQESVQKKLGETKTELEANKQALPLIEKAVTDFKNAWEQCAKEKEEQLPLFLERKIRLQEALLLEKEVVALEEQRGGLLSQYKEKMLAKNKVSDSLLALSKENEGLEVEISQWKQALELLTPDPDLKQNLLTLLSQEKSIQEAKSLLEEESKVLAEEKRQQEDKVLAQKATGEVVASITESLRHLLERKPLHREAQKEKEEALRICCVSVEKLRENAQQMSRLQLAMDQQAKAVEAFEAEKQSLEKHIEAQEATMCSLLEALTQAKAKAEKHMAYTLALALKPGVACRVCGSPDHPKPCQSQQDEGEENAEAVLEDERQQAAAKLLQLRESVFLLQGKLQTATELKKQAQGQWEEKKALQEEITTTLPEDLRSLSTEALHEKVTFMQAAFVRESQDLENWEAEHQAMSSELSQKQASHAVLLAEEKVMWEAVEKAHLKFYRAQETLLKLQESFDAKKDQWHITDLKQAYEKLEADEKMQRILRDQMDQHQQRINNSKAEMNKYQVELQERIQEVSGIETQGKALKANIDEKKEKIRLVLGQEGSLTEALKQLEQRLKALEAAESRAKEALTAQEQLQKEEQSRGLSLAKQEEMLEKQWAQETTLLADKIRDLGFVSVEEAKEAKLPQEDQSELAQVIAAFETAEGACRSKKEMLEEKLAGRSMDKAAFVALKENYEKQKRLRDDIFGQVEVKKHHYERLKDKHLLWKAHQKELGTLTQKLDLVKQLRELMKGNSFIDFVAEERLRYVARQAQEVLGGLTGHRYCLELDSEAQFVIRDNFHGGMHRTVSTLSGGETFLTALSLALALSGHIQLKGLSPLEFFFLDEGFGTLDSALLDTVIDALEKLGSRERVIGLISHVPELRMRIPRRIIVTPPSGANEGSRVRLERG